MLYTVRKVFKFEAAHILDAAYSKCCTACIHGHSYTVEVFIQRQATNPANNMVIDFGLLSNALRPTFAYYDHSLILPPHLHDIYSSQCQDLGLDPNKLILFPENPTAEAMARIFFGLAEEALKHVITDPMVSIRSVRVHETDTGFAEYTENQHE